ncbi:MAG: hypothetical protein A2664_01290 [Candidatus Taylorbacteria bacterium RIFCSPHIGHO2_01_FULL_46_22b]|uniref:DUF721 domain-containing protein n=1 Tax=Candidatus Taylorbacteria bacterium RIFCSPHIGHO2_01_FULL_46_22b TaxID=1802301 RepID=A0A1G2M251_9BACT|nr:MAG: hypothetical protein A2664_01290 [Candidatus Taylorbacteria bacterium RIFCSPHIGHO2_01_FULL_46_22b]
MEWKDINPLLERFKKLLSGSVASRETISRLASEVLNIPISMSAVTIKNTVAIFSVHPTIKVELLLKKEKLLSLIHKEVGSKVISDIR